VTFSTHIAKIVHQRCAPCHHEGQAAPFNLLTYDDVHKRLKLILETIESQAMPPWLAEPGHGNFSNERRLPDEERALLRQWATAGAPEGDPRSAPAPPRWPAGWLEGTPDLVATMAKPYALGADGPDVYRYFVIPLSLDRDRWVRAVEFSPGNRKIVHHAFIRVDEEGQARQLEGTEGEPGLSKMLSRTRMPGGQFLTWNPGTRPVVSPPGLAWRLRKGSDLVVEMHLNRTGKPETIQSAVGLYFTDEPPTNTCYTFKLGSYDLHFPAGATNVIVKDSLVLPVDVDVLAAYPHAHFLGREMQAYAIRPDGVKEWLLWIKRWDFNWQGDYRYTRPVRLAKGTTLHLQFSYDNSTNNPVNPHQPPQRVQYGERSSDEMCELGLQVLAGRTNDLKALQESVAAHQAALGDEPLRKRIAAHPDDAEALTRLGMSLWGQTRVPEARVLLDRAIRARPDFAEARFNKGVFLRFAGQLPRARLELETALRLDPRLARAHQQLGFTFASLGRLADSQRHFEKALELDPADLASRDGLAEVRRHIQSSPGPD